MRCNLTNDKVPTNKKNGTHIVISLIEVWQPEKPYDFISEPTQNCVRLCECQSMECSESYKQLVWGMELVLPKGTIIHKTIATPEDRESSNKMIVSHSVEGGVVVSTTAKTEVANATVFKPGNRIRVYAGYTTDPEIAKLNRLDLPLDKTIYGSSSLLDKYRSSMDKVFDGFISKCSPSAPFMISAESIAVVFRRLSCGMDKNNQSGCTLKTLFDPSGKWKLLNGTNIELHSKNPLDKLDNVGVIPNLRTDMTIADVLVGWSKSYNVYFRMQEDNAVPKLRVGYSFSSGAVSDSEDLPSIHGNGENDIPTIFFDYNVADDNISFARVDKYNLAVKYIVTTVGQKGARGTYSFYLRLDPSKAGNPDADKNYIVYDEKTISKQDRKKLKAKGGKPSYDHSGYTIIERVDSEIIKVAELKKDILKARAIAQFEDYLENGFDGSLTLFGDLGIHTGDIVEFNDSLHPERNGKYLVDSVTTKLSVNGLRQTIQVPYKVSSNTDNK